MPIREAARTLVPLNLVFARAKPSVKICRRANRSSRAVTCLVGNASVRIDNGSEASPDTATRPDCPDEGGDDQRRSVSALREDLGCGHDHPTQRGERSVLDVE